MNTIEKSLTEIQKNLEKLESARNQVLDVTKSSKEISELMIDLVKNIKEVQVIISGESDSFIKGFVKNEKKVDDAVKGIIDKWQFSILSFETSLKTFTNQVSEKINESGDNVTLKTNSFLEQQEFAFNKNLLNLESSNKTLSDFKKNLTEFDFYKQVKPLELKIEEFEKLISKRIQDSYTETTKITKQIATDNLEAIHELKLPKLIDKLNADVVKTVSIIHNLQEKLLDFEINISHKLNNIADKSSGLFLNLEKKIEANAKKQLINTYITWAIILIAAIALKYL